VFGWGKNAEAAEEKVAEETKYTKTAFAVGLVAVSGAAIAAAFYFKPEATKGMAASFATAVSNAKDSAMEMIGRG